MVRETRVSPDSLVYPLFLIEGEKIKEPIESLDGQHRYSPDRVCEAIADCRAAGVSRVLLFGIPARKLPGVAPGVDISRDIVKLAAIERHKNTGHVGLGFLGKYGLKKGAVATSIGHDSHNLVIAGVTDEDMVLAGNRVIENGGGLAIALEGKVLADLPLPIGGLMADEPVEVVDEKLEHMKKLSVELGISEDIDAFMTLAFISLPVIPKLRLNTYGVVDVEKHQVVEARF